MYFEYGEKEINYLKSKDKKLGDAIEKIGMVERPIDDDIFTAIIRAFLGQQVSRQARETVFNRMQDSLGEIEPKTICPLTTDEIQAFGMTFRKAQYIKEFAQMVLSGELDLDSLQLLSDKEVIAKLSQIKGIGVWTAEMLLASALKRLDVFSYGDIAIHRGLRMLYRHRDISKAKFEKFRRRYSPYGTVASVYLWAIAVGAIDGLTDPKTKKKVISQAKTSVDYF